MPAQNHEKCPLQEEAAAALSGVGTPLFCEFLAFIAVVVVYPSLSPRIARPFSHFIRIWASFISSLKSVDIERAIYLPYS